jgi:hypothetical protein
MYVTGMLERRIAKSKQQKDKAVTVKIERYIYEKLDNFVSEGEKKDFVNEILLMNLERKLLLRRYHSSSLLLCLIHAEDQSLLIKDNKIDKIVEVKLYHVGKDKDDKVMFKCIEDNSESCIHAVYASALPEVGKLSTTDNNNNNKIDNRYKSV